MTLGRALSSWVVTVCAFACGPSTAKPPLDTAHGQTPDDDACRTLCDEEAHCGDSAKTCIPTCARTSAILKAGAVGRIVACRRETLASSCYGKDSAFTHGDLLSDARCFRKGAEPYAVDESNRRNWAISSCDRMLRCQQTDPAPEARKICIDAATHPGENEDREAMTVVDALRDEVVKAWAACLAQGACPAAGQADAVEERCVLVALGRGGP